MHGGEIINYSVIYCDCPWYYKDKAKSGDRGAEFHYSCMKLSELCDMKTYIDSIAAPDSVLFMWATSPMLKDAMTVMEAWNFKFKIIAFTWIKTNKNPVKSLLVGENKYLVTEIDDRGDFETYGDFMGMGNHTRSNAEFVLLGVRGKGIKRVSASVRSTVISPVREHSRKPDEVRRRIEDLYGDVPRIELFARERAIGWDYFGDEIVF